MEQLYPLNIGSATLLQTNSSRDNEDSSLPRKPCARSGHCAVADEQNLYIFGGYNPSPSMIRSYFGDPDHIPLFEEVWRFHIPTSTWHLLTNEGGEHFQLASMSAMRQGRVVLLYGGTSFPFGYESSNRVSLLDLKHIDWNHPPNKGERKPIRSYGQAIAVIEPYLYVFGGTTGWAYCADIHRYHLQTHTWENVFDLEQYATSLVKREGVMDKSIPLPRYRHEMLCDGKKLYVIGGGTSHAAFKMEQINTFDTEKKEWSLQPTIPDGVHGFPGPRRCHGCSQLGNVGYISGGFDGRHIYDDIWVLSLDSLRWTKLQTKLPRPVYFHASAITPTGCLYIHGGVLDGSGRERSKDLVRVWVRIPSLLLLAWNRVLSCLNNPSGIQKDKLRLLGVPLSLLPDIGG